MTTEVAAAVPALRIEVADGGEGVVVVRVAGELDTAAAPALCGALDDVLARPGGRGCVVDLTGVTFLDCAGLHPVLRARAAACRSGRTLTVHGGTDRAVGRLLELAGLQDVLAPRVAG
jgi:anti-anti-sigma factor